MTLLLKLILREAWYHRGRISLAVIATMAMSCMVVWLIGSIDLVMLQFEQDGEHYLGNYHVAMIPVRDTVAAAPSTQTQKQPPAPLFVEPDVIDDLRKNELVMQVSPARQIRNTMAKWTDDQSVLRRQRAGTGIPMGSPTIIGIDTTDSPFELEDGKWFADDSKSAEPAMEGVIGTTAAKSLRVWGEDNNAPVKVGDFVAVRIEQAEYKIKVVGTVEQKLGGAFGGSGGITPAVGALYVSPETAEKIKPQDENVKGKAQYLYVRLRDGANVRQFKENWKKHLSAANITMKFIDANDIQETLNKQRGRSTVGLVSGAASINSIIIFSTLVSILIVFTALSMGVNERSRVFAMLRTVGMSRWKIAFLIFGESIILCLLGWVGGMAAGWFVLQLSVWLQPGAFGTGKIVSLGMTSVSTSGIAALIGSLLAAIIPAWRGACIQPLEGMNRGYIYSLEKKWFIVCGIVGVLFLTINPFICYYEPLAKGSELRQFLYTFIGLPTQLGGFVLLTPLVILLTEICFTPLIAALLNVRGELLAKQLSSNLWRTLGTAIALCIGLGVYSFLEIAGYSMLVPFTHSKTLPNTLVTFLPTGLPYSEIETVQKLDGIDSSRFLSIALEQPLFSREQSQQFLANGMSEMQTNAGVVVFGLNISEAFEKRPDGSRPLVVVDFVEGTLASALEKLKTGERYCIVPDSFAFRAGLHVGDKLKLLPHQETPRFFGGGGRGRGGMAAAQQQPIEYEICGVCSVPGWLWMAKLSGVRKYGYRSGALMFAPYETVKNDFHINDAAYFWFDRVLDTNGKPTVSDADLERSLQMLADENSGKKSDSVERPMVKVSSREYLTGQVNDRADEVIQAASRMPLILLAISSIGMMGTIAASIRARRFELGVLRSLGITRFGLFRLILAEALLISIAAIIIALGFGVLGGWCFIGLMRYVSFFGGFVSPLTIPVFYLSIGLFVTITLCLLAALAPALLAGRTDIAALLRE
ncbi:MAG: ABC transporter permease [Planctomycetaceae bacterium]|jgi:putative ABC transport system permease protein|nr:ABC transporter permease [Planctomycetaceae bacterium]